MKPPTAQEKKLAEAVALFVERIHQRYPGVKTAPISVYEDEDFAIEVLIPPELDKGEAHDACLEECIRIEDEHDIYILPRVRHAPQS
ncbi:MAG: hypothetical protein HY314_00335 [Acidobacteria bacterium]|nr:hypothetical protein [Acidobacteriota bacterium]